MGRRHRISTTSGRLPVLLLGSTILVLALNGCSDSTSPNDPLGLLTIDAWACPDVPPSQLTLSVCLRSGDEFDPAVSDSANRISVMIVLARPEDSDQTHRVVWRIRADDDSEAFQVFSPMQFFEGRRDLLVDTIALPPIGNVSVRVTIELAAGDTRPFLRLVDDTTFFWF